LKSIFVIYIYYTFPWEKYNYNLNFVYFNKFRCWFSLCEAIYWEWPDMCWLNADMCWLNAQFTQGKFPSISNILWRLLAVKEINYENHNTQRNFSCNLQQPLARTNQKPPPIYHGIYWFPSTATAKLVARKVG